MRSRGKWRKLGKRKVFSSIERKKINLRHTANNIDEWFEDAVNPRAAELGQEIEKLQDKLNVLNENLTGEMVDEYGSQIDSNYEQGGRPSDHDLEIYDEIGGLYYEVQILEEQLLSIESMKLVYLYKNFEILLKDIIAEAFPDVNKRDLFQWENVKSFLNSNGIMFGNIQGYSIVNELRIINNNIKHSGEIDELTKKQHIPEFHEKEYFDFSSILSFYTRIKNEPKAFLANLAEELIKYLFVFDDDRIEKIVTEYKRRMDEESGKRLVAELSKIYT
jgi:hypothetical protein